jgi:DNA-binding transcriptional regulator YdaS (Cro superfamily)
MTQTQIRRQQYDALKLLCAHFNYCRPTMAKALNIEVSVIYNWFSRGRISAKKAIEAEEITGGAVTKQMLRPDVKLWMH